METSLQQQLRKLKAPQSSLLLQDKRKPSLLFDAKEAANLDRDTVYNIGIKGLQELIKLRNGFEKFQTTLFAQSSINLERSVQDSQVNKKINLEIEKFLVYLSPYFMLNAAHKTLEWLINRFHIHEFNKDHYLLLILPYHESRIFVRALQLLDLSDPADKWNWLEAIQRTRTPLPPLSLITQVVSDNGFLKLICEHVIYATKVYADKADSLSTLYAFYTTAIVGTVERSSVITDVQFNHMLPALLKGLQSQVSDFAASSYMIFAKLITKINLQDETMEKLILKAVKKPVLTQEVILLIIFLYDNPFNSLPMVSESLMLKLSSKSWFIDILIKIRNSRVNISKFIILLLQTALKFIAKDSISDDLEEVVNMVNNIFTRVPLEEDEVLHILQSTLIGDVVSEQNSDKAKNYFINLYQSIERTYPNSFDRYLHGLMHTNQVDEKTEQTLKFFTSWYSKAEKSLDIFTGLNHSNPEQRIMAIKTIGKKNVTIPDNLREIVNESLLARFNDDDDEVVKAVLTLPINFLQNTFAADTLVDELIVLISKSHTESKRKIAEPALKVLLQLCDESDDTSVFLVAVPYLFPVKDEDVDVALQILSSDFAKRNAYFKRVAEEIGDSRDAESIRSMAFHNILNSNLLPPAASILNAIKQQMSHGDAALAFFNMIILGSICRVPVGTLDPQIARQAIEMAAETVKSFPSVVPLNGATHINADKLLDALTYTDKGHLPLQVNTYVLEMVHRRLNLNVNWKFDFENDLERTELMIRVLEIVFDGMVHQEWRSNYPAWKAHHEWYLKIFFQIHFKSVEDTIRFLSQFFIKPLKPKTSFHCLQICLVLLDNCKSYQWAFNDSSFVINLIIALNSENNNCREVAVNILKKLSQTFNISMEGFSALLSELMDRHNEIALDPDQLPLVLYTLLSPDPDVSCLLKTELRPKLETIRKLLFETILSDEIAVHVQSQLLEVLTHVNGPNILKSLVPLGIRLLEKSNSEEKIFTQTSIKNILQRIDNSSVSAMSEDKVWQFFMTCMSTNNTQIVTENRKQYVSVIVLKQVDNIFFSNLGKISKKLQKEFFAKLVDIVTDSDIDAIISVITRLVKKIHIDAQLVVDELNIMTTVEEPPASIGFLKRRKRVSNIYSPQVASTRRWRRGITMLEFIQHSNNVENEELLVPVLFDVLKTCLRFEEQSPVEYTNQLVLSSLHHLATKSVPIKKADEYVDIIAQCIRTSHNPQTHHHALLVLVELFKLADIQRALQNIMPIFTFMGNTVLRQDDAYSIQIISKTIDTVVPVVNKSNNVNHVCEILRLFITSLPDIPEHRRVPLFTKLLQLLDRYLHLYYLLTFESHVFSKNLDSSQEITTERLNFALLISNQFSVQKIIEVCVKMVEFLRELPVEIDENNRNKINFHSNYIFDTTKNTPKQLRHYKFAIVRFLASLLSDAEFIKRVAEMDEEDTEALTPLYDKLIIELVMYIQNTTKNADLLQGTPRAKYWKVMLHGLYEILDLVNNLLPNQVFITNMSQLIKHKSITVRRKALELLNSRLNQKKFSDDDYEDLVVLIDPVTSVFLGPQKFVNPEVEIIQQRALITLTLLAKLLAFKHPDVFKPILELTTKIIKRRQGAVLGSAVVCVAEICGAMKVHCLENFNQFAPAIIKLLGKYCTQEIPDILTITIVSALQKVVETVGNYFSHHLDQLLYELSRLNHLYSDSQDPKIGGVASRLKAITQKISSSFRLEILLRAVNETYDSLLANKAYHLIPPLMTVIAKSFNSVESSELNNEISNLVTFFLRVLEFRETVTISKGAMEVDGETTLKDVTSVEESASKALVALVLKLNEAAFQPLYYRLYHWAARNPQHKQRNITFYRLSANIAEGLKSLFVLFAGNLPKHAASLLIANNILTIGEEAKETHLPDEDSRIELIEEILLTLLRIFKYGVHDFVNQERFETLMQPIVDQIENTMGSRENYENRAKEFIIPCITEFANAIADDSLHKQLVYQVLLKTRHTKSYVRNTALNTLVEIARKLGEDFMPLLPETIPFLAELLEDEDEVTLKNANDAVRTLEDILDEPLQKYF